MRPQYHERLIKHNPIKIKSPKHLISRNTISRLRINTINFCNSRWYLFTLSFSHSYFWVRPHPSISQTGTDASCVDKSVERNGRSVLVRESGHDFFVESPHIPKRLNTVEIKIVCVQVRTTCGHLRHEWTYLEEWGILEVGHAMHHIACPFGFGLKQNLETKSNHQFFWKHILVQHRDCDTSDDPGSSTTPGHSKKTIEPVYHHNEIVRFLQQLAVSPPGWLPAVFGARTQVKPAEIPCHRHGSIWGADRGEWRRWRGRRRR